MALFAKLPSLGVVLRFDMAAFGILDNDGRPQSANRTMATALNSRAHFDSSRSNAFPSARV
jgi:hypothetical protein